MTIKVVSAKLRWLRPEEGGRQEPPPGPSYSTVTRFDQQHDSWRKEAWSMVVEWVEKPDASMSHSVNVRFLVSAAPEKLLTTGSRFELLEGERVVAIGVIS
jgi:hypothetical protein